MIAVGYGALAVGILCGAAIIALAVFAFRRRHRVPQAKRAVEQLLGVDRGAKAYQREAMIDGGLYVVLAALGAFVIGVCIFGMIAGPTSW